jgi:hypothetical protein
MLRKAFETEIIDDGANLIGPWRSPAQMLAEHAAGVTKPSSKSRSQLSVVWASLAAC